MMSRDVQSDQGRIWLTERAPLAAYGEPASSTGIEPRSAYVSLHAYRFPSGSE